MADPVYPKVGDTVEICALRLVSHPNGRRCIAVGDRITIGAVSKDNRYVGWEVDKICLCSDSEFGNQYQAVLYNDVKIVTRATDCELGDDAPPEEPPCHCRSLLAGHESGCHYYKPVR